MYVQIGRDDSFSPPKAQLRLDALCQRRKAMGAGVAPLIFWEAHLPDVVVVLEDQECLELGRDGHGAHRVSLTST